MVVVKYEDVVKFLEENPLVKNKDLYEKFPGHDQKLIYYWKNIYMRRKIRDKKKVLIGMRQGAHHINVIEEEE